MLRVFTAFSGYDSQCLALERLKRSHGVQYSLVGWSEIDKYAIIAHNALSPDATNKNYGDISKIDWRKTPDFDLFTYSSPCQDFSTAGKQRGGKEGSGTRSSLLWECRKAIVAKKPKYLLMENVKALTSKKFMPLLQKWLKELESYGYQNYVQVLNAKDYGVPQNRERVFVFSILGGGKFAFPQPIVSKKRLKDVLETDVDEKYYLSDVAIKGFAKANKRNEKKGNGFHFEPTNGNVIAHAIRANGANGNCDNYLLSK
ncbi:MAG: DNA (cytosine-5-)-methyltransferase [Bacteroidales bacterium]|nr:DNA (cytosine-5-)-methyltransferase [Bacteroidales bacterium]